jgi:hypothetical protein
MATATATTHHLGGKTIFSITEKTPKLGEKILRVGGGLQKNSHTNDFFGKDFPTKFGC